MNNTIESLVVKVSFALFFILYLLGDFFRLIPVMIYWESMCLCLLVFLSSYIYLKFFTKNQDKPTSNDVSIFVIEKIPYYVLKGLVAIFFIFFAMWSFYVGDWCLQVMRIAFVAILIMAIVLVWMRNPKLTPR